MPGSTFSAVGVRWQDQAACKGADLDLTPAKETKRELELVRSTWCNTCPVRTECLAYALMYHMSGYWGGTDTQERRLLAYSRHRTKCPVCKGRAFVNTPDSHGICLRCGVSWKTPPEESTDDHDRG